ncbi:MAG TPA: right-handed parallel beta-helix repeat-containing protein [Acidimicrobiales bacterium]|nr:right-handed parallel beta-helix repeat-containing protein [Acidimicrobiales bacterium]
MAATVALLTVCTAGPVLAATAPAPVTIVAAPAGTGTTCTTAHPCSLAQAQATERRLAPTMTTDIHVVLEGGTYALRAPVALTAADSGTGGHRVFYQSGPGQIPVLSGGRTLTGWEPNAGGRPDVWSVAVPAGFDTRQLYVNGVGVPMAQGLPVDTTFVQTSTGFLTTSTVMDSWPDPTNVSVAFTYGNGPWTQTSCNIASISGRTITMAEPCWDNLHMPSEGVQEIGWLNNPMGGMPGLSPKKTPTVLQNACPLLSVGTWCIDRTAHRIFYWPPSGQSPTTKTVVAPALQTLMSITGTLARPVRNVTVSGIQFSYGGWTGPDTNDGFAQMQADWSLTGGGASKTEGSCQWSTPAGSCPFASWTRTPANVVVEAAHGVVLSGDRFEHLGGAGLDMYYGTQDDSVVGSVFTDIAANAIQLGATNDPEPSDVGAGADEITAGNTLADNYIHDVAGQYLGGVGIWLGYTQNSTVTHNQIDHVPYTAISIGWGGWHTNLTSPDSDPNVNSGNVISDNLLYDYMTTLGDGGAVYTNGPQATSWATALKIDGNVAYNGTNTDFSIYTDTGSEYVDIDRNFVYFQPFDSFDSGGCHTIGHIVISGNWFAQGGPAYPCYPDTDVTNSDNRTTCEDPTPVQSPNAVLQTAGLEPAYRGLLTASVPSVEMVGPRDLSTSAGGQVLISGSGFTAGANVHFGSVAARAVTVLSGNYLLATAPPGTGTEDVTVTTPAGTSAPGAADQVTYQTSPSACTDYSGSGYSTALFAS